MRTTPPSRTRPGRSARLLTLLAALVGLAFLGALCPAAALAQSSGARAATGLHISGGRLLEANGNDFVMRGVNHAHTWYPGETQSLADIKALGANSVRVVLSDGHRWSENSPADVANVVAQCKANRLICVLEVHDTTGYGEDAAAGTLDHAADYWIGLKDVLAGEEDYVIVNIGNEPWGNTDPAGWTEPTVAAVKKLRDAGFQHTIMVDAPNWGQDWQGVMRADARTVFDADATGNLVFSIHMYSVYDTAQKITDYLNAYVDAGLPILIGEFGGPADQWGDPDEDTMMATAEQLDLGYLAWSWSGNTDPVLDLALDFDPSRLSSWGERIFHGADGIARTSKEATVFGGGAPDDTEAPTAPGTPSASAVTATSVTLGWSASTDDTRVAGYDVVRVGDGAETPAATSPPTPSPCRASPPTPPTPSPSTPGTRPATVRRAPPPWTSGPARAAAPRCRVRGDVPRRRRVAGRIPGEIAVRNTGTAPLTPWTLAFTFPDGQTVTHMWGGTATQTGGAVSVTPASYTATVPAGGTVTLGFTAAKGTANTAPTAFSVNGTACA